ncbi:MAG: hypothetical protein H7239_03535 [Flavobacterium sp.]|nr:hypothetical protein [Flavobacterium sp.]
MKKLITLLALSFIIALSVQAQSLVSAEIQKKQSIDYQWINKYIVFKIYQNEDQLSASKLSVVTTQKQNKICVSQNQLSVVVKNFFSNNTMALKDFLKLLKSDTILFYRFNSTIQPYNT